MSVAMHHQKVETCASGKSTVRRLVTPTGEEFKYYRIPNARSRRYIQDVVTLPDQLSGHQREAVLSLCEANRASLKEWFGTLSPPNLNTLSGEFDAHLLDQGGPIRYSLTASLFGMHGAWVGKAFHPVGENVGVGYNCFQSGGRIVRKLPMDTTIEPSTLDDRRSMFLRYRAKNRGLVRALVGEVRQVSAGVLLGVGVFGAAISNRVAWHRKIPFVMYGPTRTFQPSSVRGEAKRAA